MGTDATGDVEEAFLLRQREPACHVWTTDEHDATPATPAPTPIAGSRGRILAALARWFAPAAEPPVTPWADFWETWYDR
jgi:hypothetical protein